VGVAADGLTSALNAYGEAAGGAANVSDAFFAAVKAGKTAQQVHREMSRTYPAPQRSR
jgi:hypothetical protein